MTAGILFIDSDHAKIFSLQPNKVDLLELQKSDHQSHSPPEYNLEHEKHFFHVVATKLKDVKELLIVGPSYAKNKFELHLKTHHHDDIAKSIVGVETIENLSDAQILEVGRKFFKTYDLFN